jgi:hypothetical protein
VLHQTFFLIAVKDKNMVRTRSAGQVEHPKKILPTETKPLPTKLKQQNKPVENSSKSEPR